MVSSQVVPLPRIWFLGFSREGGQSSNVIELPEGSIPWVAMEFSGVIPNNVEISSVTSASATGAVTPASQDVGVRRTSVHLKLTGGTAGADTTVTITVLLTDSTTVVGKARARFV